MARIPTGGCGPSAHPRHCGYLSKTALFRRDERFRVIEAYISGYIADVAGLRFYGDVVDLQRRNFRTAGPL
jgi:hypothetical protein